MNYNSKVLYRDFQVDLIKTISIFGVVVIHSLYFFENESNYNLYISSFFRFCVPCFIILWAYYFEKSYSKKNNEERKLLIIVRFKHLFKVFCVWSILYFFLLANWHSISIKKIITTYFLGYGWSGQYFFIILFQLLLLYPIIRFIYLNKYYRYIIIIILLIIYYVYNYYIEQLPQIILTLGNRVFIYWIPYVFLGIFFAKNKLIKIPEIFSLSIFLIPIETFILHYFNLKQDVYITIVVLLTSSLFCLSIFRNEHCNKVNGFYKMVNYLGANTMIIFVANPIVIYLLKKLFVNHIPIESSLMLKLLLVLILSCFIIFICILINKLLIKIKINTYLF